MARLVQLLLPLSCAVFAVAHPLGPPLHIPGLPHLPHPVLEALHKQPLDKNFDHPSWLHHVMGQRHPSLDEDVHSYNIHHKEESYEDFNPFLNGGFDQYFGGPFGMGNFDPMSRITFPGMSNGFNVPDNGFNSPNPLPSQVVSNPEEQHKKDSNDDSIAVKNPTEKPEDVPLSGKKPAEQDQDSKSNDAAISNIPKKPEELAPKTNEIKKNITSEDKGDKIGNIVDLHKNKDYLLVGSGNNGNSVYLLHENNPTVVVPNANQLPNNAGQYNNPVPQVVNQQPTNLQVGPDKITLNGNNNGVPSTVQPINTGNQNHGYVLVYSNGQLMQIPGVVLNSAQNNVPVQNSNPIQGTSYVIANAVPNNVQATPNAGTNVIYATLPNQGSNSPIVIQMPQCIHTMANHVCGSGAVVQNPVQGVNNANVMSNNGLVSNAVYQPNQNFVAQPAVILPNGVSNDNAQPTTIQISIPRQGAVVSNQNGTPQLAVQLPVNSGSNQYNQPIVPNLQPNSAVNDPNQGTVNSQNVVLQPADEILANTSPNGYNNNQPIVTVQPANIATQNQGDNSQNLPIQPSTSVNNALNGNNQPQAATQRDQGTVSSPSRDEAVNHPKIDIRNAIPETTQSNNNGIALDENSLASLGAQPAIMISGFKETTNDKNGKAKKAKKDKSKKKNKKNKDSSGSKEQKPLTNKKK